MQQIALIVNHQHHLEIKPKQNHKKEIQWNNIHPLFGDSLMRGLQDTTRRNPSADAILEIRSYLDEPRIQRAEDPLRWWKSKASVYPRLAQVMASRMCVWVRQFRQRGYFLKQAK